MSCGLSILFWCSGIGFNGAKITDLGDPELDALSFGECFIPTPDTEDSNWRYWDWPDSSIDETFCFEKRI